MQSVCRSICSMLCTPPVVRQNSAKEQQVRGSVGILFLPLVIVSRFAIMFPCVFVSVFVYVVKIACASLFAPVATRPFVSLMYGARSWSFRCVWQCAGPHV